MTTELLNLSLETKNFPTKKVECPVKKAMKSLTISNFVTNDEHHDILHLSHEKVG